MKAYVRRPDFILAEQWIDEAPPNLVCFEACPESGALPHTHSANGVQRAYRGDFIVQRDFGDVYPVKPDIFNEIYEEVGEDDGSEE